MTDEIGAKDEIFALFEAALNAQTVITTPIPEVFWPGVEKSHKPNPEQFYIRPTFTILNTSQASFCSCVGEDGKRRYASQGIVTFAIYCPPTIANSFRLGEQLAKVLRVPFRSQAETWFRDARIMAGFQEDRFWRINFIVEFYFQEVA